MIMPVMPGTHLTLDWQLPHRGEWYGRLAESFTVVRYDGRGAGLSQREVQDLSIDAHVADLRVIVDKLALDQLALLSRHISAPVAIRFAVENPERVSRLVLWNAVYRFADFTSTRRQQALNLLLEHDFELFTETVAYAGQGWPETHRARQFAEYMRASISQAMYRRLSARLSGRRRVEPAAPCIVPRAGVPSSRCRRSSTWPSVRSSPRDWAMLAWSSRREARPRFLVKISQTLPTRSSRS